MFKLLLAPEAQRCARAPLAVFIPHLFCVAPVSDSSVSSLSVPFSHSLREYTTAALFLSFIFHIKDICLFSGHSLVHLPLQPHRLLSTHHGSVHPLFRQPLRQAMLSSCSLLLQLLLLQCWDLSLCFPLQLCCCSLSRATTC